MSKYNANSTMKILGKQCSVELIGKGKIAADDFKNVLSAHIANRINSYFDIGRDTFMLGYIYGKRAERAKRHRKMSGYKSSLLAMVEQMDEETDKEMLRTLHTFAEKYRGNQQKQKEVRIFIETYVD